MHGIGATGDNRRRDWQCAQSGARGSRLAIGLGQAFRTLNCSPAKGKTTPEDLSRGCPVGHSQSSVCPQCSSLPLVWGCYRHMQNTIYGRAGNGCQFTDRHNFTGWVLTSEARSVSLNKMLLPTTCPLAGFGWLSISYQRFQPFRKYA